MNGYVCAQRIRAFYDKKPLFDFSEGQRFCPFLVALSEFVNKDIESKAKDSGFDMAI